ncbi:iron dicitrate transporter FecR [Empedobacter brevis NBRC 14943 = ATCC 43319]|uniref:Iron dicitrate transporter FecR n=1 Tax=Empedobacter brevis NBRC 14943 = ATCC 43319 TaxID=1218108 RepID=A0A511NIT5_9FLAO|nr:FecR family protein [Empedobacter brevis]GEM52730.1 iron dicitrate transporter FecR [Empedobacter brevis NBRC 14943 = ATCC 43319]
MERQNYIRELFKKFAEDKCTDDEKRILIAYLKESNDDPDSILPDMEELEPALEEASFSDKTRDRILSSIHSKAGISRKKNHRRIYWAAAVLIFILLSTGIALQYFYFSNSSESHFELNGNDITLTNERGEVQILDPTQVKIIQSESGTFEQNRTTLDFSGNTQSEKLVFNTLRVPYGKTFSLILSDGTKIELNAGTSVTFPVNFIDSEPNRDITLIGEAYFDVKKNSKHPFIVHSGKMDVKVLGTSFNVSNYPESKISEVVLVKGGVSLTQNKETASAPTLILSPGEKGSFNQSSGQVKKETVVTGIYTAWRNGELVFRNTSFENILVMLERKYNVEIVNQNKELAHEMFNASFKEESVENILDYFKMTNGITYTRKENKIIIH